MAFSATSGQSGHALWLSGQVGWGGIGLEAAKAGGDAHAANRYRVPEISNVKISKLVAEKATASL
ncbi:MAG: hypothetical protein AAFQ12_02980, partial [Pseudomonadota bacterium]